MGQHLSDAPRDIATLTFDLAGDGPSRRYGSSSSICTLSLKFVGLSVQKIWRTSGLNILSAWWPWLLLEIFAHYCSTIFLPVLVFLGRFVLDLSVNTCYTHNVTLRPWPLSLEVMALVADAGSSCSVCIPSLNFVGIPVRKILRIYCVSTSRPGDLELWPWNWCALLPVWWTTFPPILVLLGCFVLDLLVNTCQTRHVTLPPLRLTFEVAALVADAGLRAPSAYQVWTS